MTLFALLFLAVAIVCDHLPRAKPVALLCLLLGIALACAGCNELTLGTATGHGGEAVTVDGVLALDPDVQVAGIQSDVTAAFPITCSPMNGNPMLSAGSALQAPSGLWWARVIVLLYNEPAWIGTTTVFRCTITIPTDAAPGHYALTLSNWQAADSAGTKVPLKATSGGIDVL